jgi:hypothetical protein
MVLPAKTDWAVGETVDNVKLNALGTAVNDAVALVAGFTYNQTTPAATWTITHTLGRKPTTVTVWIADVQVMADIVAANTTTVTITFASPQSGRAQLV